MTRRSANRIRQLKEEDGTMLTDSDMIQDRIFQYFRSRWNPTLGVDSHMQLPLPVIRVTEQENLTLTRSVSYLDVRDALWSLGEDKAPGPDGFPPFFFRRYWTIVGAEVVEAVQAAFHYGIPADWKKTLVTLIPKRAGASSPCHFRPISLCTTIYKVCAKVLVGRLQQLIPRLISPEQGAFVRGRGVTDNILLAQEFMHDLRRAPSRRSLMAIKLDMERAYDRMSWFFIRRSLHEFGFSDSWSRWIMDCVEGPSYAILVNGTATDFFPSTIGLRQGCPLSPYLFILCADALSRALGEEVQRSRLVPYRIAPSAQPLSHLLFADDCLLIGQGSLQNARSFAYAVESYCRESGQIVNLHKSSVIFSPKIKSRSKLEILTTLGIPEQQGILTYLGVPMTGGRLRMLEVQPMVQRVRDRLEGYQATTLSMMGRVILIRSVLSSIPVYLLANTMIPISCLRKLEQIFRNFLWRHRQDRQGIHLLDWDTICRPIREGGLGIQSLVARREALIVKHAARYILQPNCLWSRLMRSRYGVWSQGAQIQLIRGCSFIWKEICAYAPIAMAHVRCLVGDGTTIDVIQDAWISPIPLSRWPTYVNVEATDNLKVHDLLREDGRTWRTHDLSRLFGSQLIARILAVPIPLHRERDLRVWGPSCSPKPPSCSLYNLCRGHSDTTFGAAWIWRLPIHPRVQLFLWKMAWNRLPTKALLSRRGMDIEGCCPFCGAYQETTEHSILSCPRARQIWRTAGSWPWDDDGNAGLHSFLRFIHLSSDHDACLAAYIAYQVWLARNALIFEAEDTPIHRIILRARCLLSEYRRFDATIPLTTPGSWASLAAPAAAQRAISISWEPPPLGFVKVNFDGSVRGTVGGAGYVIRSADGSLLAAGGIFLQDCSVPEAELRGAWAGIVSATQQLRAQRILIEGDSATVIAWIQGRAAREDAHPLLCDCWQLLQDPTVTVARHVYREANSAADWVASYAAQHSIDWTWSQGDRIPPSLHMYLYLDLMGCPRVRVV